jgi:uridine kinase
MGNGRGTIWIGEERTTVQVSFPDGRVLEGRRGTPLVEFLRVAFPDRANPPVAAIVGDELQELARPVTRDTEIAPVLLSDSDGMRIYYRSLSFLLIVAASNLFPEARVSIDYSVPYGGYFCRVERRPPFSAEELASIKDRMRALVHEDRPIERRRMTLDEAIALFASRGEEDKVRLFQGFTDDHLHVYALDGFLDYFYGYMVPSTGYLQTFSLELFPEGFLLRLPRREDPAKLVPAKRFSALREVFTEYGRWLDLIGVRDVASLNAAIRSGRIEEAILVSEALHEKRVAQIALLLAERKNAQHRLVFVAGPSSSGKTTFSKRLAVQLLANGIHPHPVAMDDYFLPRAALQSEGTRALDFDSLAALDLPFFETQLRALLNGEEVTLPRYDFPTGERQTGRSIRMNPDDILIVEGIHGLNPSLLSSFPDEDVFRIFVSALTQLNLDRHNRVPTTDTRLIRRIVRDAVFRGYDAGETLSMWESVRQGEKENIFPYQERADVMFNSALVYELAVLRPLVEPLLFQVRDAALRLEAERLLGFLRWFEPYSGTTIPGNSILREFIGGSTLTHFAAEIAGKHRRPRPAGAERDRGRTPLPGRPAARDSRTRKEVR